MVDRIERVRPLLRWAGSKQKLLPELLQFWNAGFGRYVEPFVGSGALFYALQPPSALLSDLNGELIETLSTIRNRPHAVYDALEILPRSKDSYYCLRAQSPASLTPTARAARFVFLNRYCFNGLYRTNLAGNFNVPYAPTKTGSIPDRTSFVRSAGLLRRARLLNQDFEAAINLHVTANDFVYLDPPYAVGNRRIFRQYGPHTFGTDDLARLNDSLNLIHTRGAHFVLSYAYCTEALRTFRDWPARKVYCQRNISGFAKHRRRAAELIVTNC